jgi:hypothetical protein
VKQQRLGRGQREAAFALTPLDSLEAQNASIRAAGGGIFGGIATELLNLSPLRNAPARIEEATLGEKGRRDDLDFVRTTQLQIATQSGERSAMLGQGAVASRIAGIRGRLGEKQFEINQKIGDWKANIGARYDPDMFSQSLIDDYRGQLSALPAGSEVRVSGTTGESYISINNEGTYSLRSVGRGGVTNTQELNPFVMSSSERAARRQRISEAQKQGGEATKQADYEIGVLERLDRIEQDAIGVQSQATGALLGGGNPRLINRERRQGLATADIQKYAEEHGGGISSATYRYAKLKYGEAELEGRNDDAQAVGAALSAQGIRLSLGFHARNMGFEAGFAGIAGDLSSKYAAAVQDPETQANILIAGQAQLRDYTATAFRAATSRSRTNRAEAAAMRLRAQGLDAEANEVAINEQEAQGLDEAGTGLFAAAFLRPGIRYRAAQSRIVNKYEDSRKTGLELQSLHDQVTIARLESEGRPGTAQVETVRLQALQEVAALRGDDHFQERRKTILQRASFQEKALQRQFMNEIFAGSVEQTVGGTFAPGVGFNYPWEEDRQRKIAAADAAGRDLEDQSNKPGTPPQVGGPDLNDIYNLLQGDLKNAIIGIWQAITQG